ncbi:MFS general substrate transporter [Neolentinus lepideus HHB14362 ss-1]|uniref:MFS general substrate transporter n=1 Tax=Neolentinus lepideus HHB14362 ss-1 TaxID=1314782 RepID=A0A165WC41_9AGAM|nr:MFS general substrate transporter [Neolentinus lepideus HHB14362 ss-1]
MDDLGQNNKGNVGSRNVEKKDSAGVNVTVAVAELGVGSGHVLVEEGADAALRYASASVIQVDDVLNRRLRRKIDLHVLPWLCGLYVLQYLDKGVLSYAGVMGIQNDAHLTASDYNWLGSIYYAGYLAFVPIHNRLFQVFPPSKYIACCMVAWGIVLSTMTVCTPSLHGVATIIGGIIAYGCLDGEEKHPNAKFSGWKILALCTGLLSVVYGTCMLYFMAGSIVTARFFTSEEKTLAVERLRNNHQGVGSNKYKAYQAKEAWLDCRTWMYVVFVLSAQSPAGGLVLLSSILIKSIGFDSKTTLLLSIPQGVVAILANIGFGYLADKTKQRSGAAILAGLLSLFAACLLFGPGNVGPYYRQYGQLIAYFIMSGTSSTSWYIVISMMSSNVLGTTKKTSLNAIVFVTLGVAYFAGPQTFRDPPYYHSGKVTIIVLWIVSILVLLGFHILNRLENRRRDRLLAEKGNVEMTNIEFMDLTDKENTLFRYVV